MAHDLYKKAGSAERPTPKDFFERVNQVWRFTLDVCATEHNNKVARYFAPPDHRLKPIMNAPLALDGLAQSWAGEICWMNPPYSRGVLVKWVEKAIHEAVRGAVVVALLPGDSSVVWHHELVLLNAAWVEPVRGRIKFEGMDAGAKTGNILAHFLPPDYAVANPKKKRSA